MKTTTRTHHSNRPGQLLLGAGLAAAAAAVLAYGAGRLLIRKMDLLSEDVDEVLRDQRRVLEGERRETGHVLRQVLAEQNPAALRRRLHSLAETLLGNVAAMDWRIDDVKIDPESLAGTPGPATDATPGGRDEDDSGEDDSGEDDSGEDDSDGHVREDPELEGRANGHGPVPVGGAVSRGA